MRNKYLLYNINEGYIFLHNINVDRNMMGSLEDFYTPGGAEKLLFYFTLKAIKMNKQSRVTWHDAHYPLRLGIIPKWRVLGLADR